MFCWRHRDLDSLRPDRPVGWEIVQTVSTPRSRRLHNARRPDLSGLSGLNVGSATIGAWPTSGAGYPLPISGCAGASRSGVFCRPSCDASLTECGSQGFGTHLAPTDPRPAGSGSCDSGSPHGWGRDPSPGSPARLQATAPGRSDRADSVLHATGPWRLPTGAGLTDGPGSAATDQPKSSSTPGPSPGAGTGPPVRGTGVYSLAPGGTVRQGSGTVVTYRVEVENGAGQSAPAFAAAVDATWQTRLAGPARVDGRCSGSPGRRPTWSFASPRPPRSATCAEPQVWRTLPIHPVVRGKSS